MDSRPIGSVCNLPIIIIKRNPYMSGHWLQVLSPPWTLLNSYLIWILDDSLLIFISFWLFCSILPMYIIIPLFALFKWNLVAYKKDTKFFSCLKYNQFFSSLKFKKFYFRPWKFKMPMILSFCPLLLRFLVAWPTEYMF